MSRSFVRTDLSYFDYMKNDFKFDVTAHFLQRCRERHISSAFVKKVLFHGLSQIIKDAQINGTLIKADDCNVVTALQDENSKIYIVLRVYYNTNGRIVIKFITIVKHDRIKHNNMNEDGSETVVHQINFNENNYGFNF